MRCSYCLTDFHAATTAGGFEFTHQPRLPGSPVEDPNLYFSWVSVVCSKCLGPHIYLQIRRFKGVNAVEEIEYRLVQPRTGGFLPPPPEVPSSIASDYVESNEVLHTSAKASAALARRCLQAILSAQGYVARDLVKQVEAVLSEADSSKALPTSLRENIDAIRNFGNFSAHPVNDHTTLQIIEVESGEAEWCLQIILDLFDHYYVYPALAAKKRAALAAKLAAAGKPPMKN